MVFDGYPREGLEFLAGLAAHNDKAWYEPRKAVYEQAVKQPTIELVAALNDELARCAPDYRVPDPARAVPRLHRDTRFSKDKSPYKTEIGVVLPRAGVPKEEAAGFFFSIGPTEVTVLGGTYLPGPPQLAALRHALATRTDELRALVTAPALVAAMGELQGDRLQRVPKGYPPDHPAGDLLRHTQLYFRTRLPVAVAGTGALVGEISRRLELMTPFVTALDAILETARTPS